MKLILSCRRSSAMLRRLMHASACHLASASSSTMTPSSSKQSIPSVEQTFAQPRVQLLMQELTGVDVPKVFPKKPSEIRDRPYYQLLTDDELIEMNAKIKREAQMRLVPPPFMDPRPSRTELIANDPELADHDNVNMVFTDISYNVTLRERLVVVRQSDGKLRTATHDEHDRVIRTYYMEQGRPVKTPKIFEPENVQRVLSENNHVFLMDWACLFFEPDDPDYIRVRDTTYNHVVNNSLYDILWSTRHFGGLVFYLALNKNIDSLLIYYAHNRKLDDVLNLIQLYHTVHPSTPSAAMQLDSLKPFQFIKNFVDKDSKRRADVRRAMADLEQYLADEATETKKEVQL